MLYKVTTASGQEHISDTIVPVRLKGDTYIPPKQGQEADGFCAKIPVGDDETLQDTVFVYEGHTMKGTEETATWEEVQAVPTLIDMGNTINNTIGLAKADHELEVGEYVSYENKMYRVTVPIAAGGIIAPGTNCVETTIANELNNN